MEKKIFAVVLFSFSLFTFSPLAANAACSQVAGKTYYSDSVSYFKDSACHQEMSAADVEAAGVGYISTGSANCKYNISKKQYTDGTSFFLNNKCTDEAAPGETAAAPTTQTVTAQTQTQTQAQVAVADATQYAQMNQRIAALENQVKILMQIITQVLALLANR
ncbi:MAG: hypothetical protein L7H18_00905 [Candidatus Nealsonbacteria bacterium DGGOD1a]|nr:MAG: hypothetical protein L7H18_00905 [Candidatus Nealsonbacteria bacterium DGGOD1a]